MLNVFKGIVHQRKKKRKDFPIHSRILVLTMFPKIYIVFLQIGAQDQQHGHLLLRVGILWHFLKSLSFFCAIHFPAHLDTLTLSCEKATQFLFNWLYDQFDWWKASANQQ